MSYPDSQQRVNLERLSKISKSCRQPQPQPINSQLALCGCSNSRDFVLKPDRTKGERVIEGGRGGRVLQALGLF